MTPSLKNTAVHCAKTSSPVRIFTTPTGTTLDQEAIISQRNNGKCLLTGLLTFAVAPFSTQQLEESFESPNRVNLLFKILQDFLSYSIKSKFMILAYKVLHNLDTTLLFWCHVILLFFCSWNTAGSSYLVLPLLSLHLEFCVPLFP